MRSMHLESSLAASQIVEGDVSCELQHTIMKYSRGEADKLVEV